MVLYAQNGFDLTKCGPEWFLEKIDRRNASFIRYLYIDFPWYVEPLDVTFGEYDSCILARIQSDCSRLTTLHASPETTEEMVRKFDTLDNFNIIREMVSQLNARFKSIASLRRVFVDVYEDPCYITTETVKYGWKLNMCARP